MATCADLNQICQDVQDLWPFCGNAVCPDPVWKPASLLVLRHLLEPRHRRLRVQQPGELGMLGHLSHDGACFSMSEPRSTYFNGKNTQQQLTNMCLFHGPVALTLRMSAKIDIRGTGGVRP